MEFFPNLPSDQISYIPASNNYKAVQLPFRILFFNKTNGYINVSAARLFWVAKWLIFTYSLSMCLAQPTEN